MSESKLDYPVAPAIILRIGIFLACMVAAVAA
jgi:hypothetical protein